MEALSNQELSPSLAGCVLVTGTDLAHTNADVALIGKSGFLSVYTPIALSSTWRSRPEHWEWARKLVEEDNGSEILPTIIRTLAMDAVCTEDLLRAVYNGRLNSDSHQKLFESAFTTEISGKNPAHVHWVGRAMRRKLLDTLVHCAATKEPADVWARPLCSLPLPSSEHIRSGEMEKFQQHHTNWMEVVSSFSQLWNISQEHKSIIHAPSAGSGISNSESDSTPVAVALFNMSVREGQVRGISAVKANLCNAAAGLSASLAVCNYCLMYRFTFTNEVNS